MLFFLASAFGGESTLAVYVAPVTQRINSPDFSEVENAVLELLQKHDPQSAKLFGALYANGNAQRRLLAIRSIGELAQHGTEDSLVTVALDDLYQAIRFAAVDALGRIETRDRATARFIEVAHDKTRTPVHRYRAFLAVARLNGLGATAFLRAWLKAAEPSSRTTAPTKQPRPPRPGESPESPPNPLQQETDFAVAAAEALGWSGDLDQAGVLIDALSSKNPEVATAARSALAHLTGNDFGSDLIKWGEWRKAQRNQLGARHEKADASLADGAPAPAYDPYADPIGQAPLDLVIVYDTTASMARHWKYLRAAIQSALEELLKTNRSVRIATVKFRAATIWKETDYMFQITPLTSNCAETISGIQHPGFGGQSGGLNLGLRHALSDLAWRVHSRKVILLVGDCSPDNELSACVHMCADSWEMDRVIVDTIFVKTSHGREHRQTFKDLGQAGVGRFYDFTGPGPHLLDFTAEKPDHPKPDYQKPDLDREIAARLCTPRAPHAADEKQLAAAASRVIPPIVEAPEPPLTRIGPGDDDDLPQADSEQKPARENSDVAIVAEPKAGNLANDVDEDGAMSIRKRPDTPAEKAKVPAGLPPALAAKIPPPRKPNGVDPADVQRRIEELKDIGSPVAAEAREALKKVAADPSIKMSAALETLLDPQQKSDEWTRIGAIRGLEMCDPCEQGAQVLAWCAVQDPSRDVRHEACIAIRKSNNILAAAKVMCMGLNYENLQAASAAALREIGEEEVFKLLLLLNDPKTVSREEYWAWLKGTIPSPVREETSYVSGFIGARKTRNETQKEGSEFKYAGVEELLRAIAGKDVSHYGWDKWLKELQGVLTSQDRDQHEDRTLNHSSTISHD